MKLQFIEPFVSSAMSVLKTVLRSDIGQGDVTLVGGHELAGEVSAVIGIRDSPGESIILNMDSRTALNICAAMNGSGCESLDSLGRDAIGELANMIAGNAVSALNEQGFDFIVQPPVTVTQVDLPRITEGLELFQVPVSSEHGHITVNFTIRTN
jgi:chemotaxis protein CheX